MDDERIERFSRQIVLAEIGPRGQMRLGAARVAVVGDGAAATRIVAYLAAAGVGWIAAAPALHAAVDLAQPDLKLVSLGDAGEARIDAAVVAVASLADAATAVARWSLRADTLLWIAAGRAGGAPPCPACAGVETSHASPDSARLADPLLGTVVATETVKALLAIGTPLRGRVLAWDPDTASVTNLHIEPRPDCACRRLIATE